MLAKESAGPNFDLPEEVLEVLPSDPFEQLDVARKITSIALSTRVSSLESERSVLRAQLTDKDNLIADLQSQIDSLDSSLSDAADKLARADHEKVPGPISIRFIHGFTHSLYMYVIVLSMYCRRAC
ncbi:hypothetical protein CsSME_00033343 [Camellia sinensis var. sinensis]